MGLGSRLGGYVGVYRRFVRQGVRRRSLLLYPLRRRLRNGCSRLDLVGGDSLVAGPDDPLLALFDEIWVSERYRPSHWSAIPASTVVDVGANVGVFALWASRRLDAKRVIAIEPAPGTAATLLQNLERNAIPRPTVLQAALGSDRREAKLYRRGQSAMDSMFARDLYGSRFEEASLVRVLTLDDVFELFGIRRCQLLKLDCEGAEYEVLFAASAETLSRVECLVLEYHVGLNDHHPRELEDFLREHGFQVTLHPPLDVEGGHLHAIRAG